MTPKSAVSLPGRWSVALSASMVLSGAAGAVEGWYATPGEHTARAALLNAGLFAPLGAALGLISIGLLVLVAGSDPPTNLRLFRLRLARDPAANQDFVARSLALGFSLLIFILASYHLAKICLSAFHHMGLAALLIAAVLAGLGFALWIVAASSGRKIAGLLKRLSQPALKLLGILSILLVPSALLAAVAISPVDGSGMIGFMGLLKREELELAFLGWAAVPAGAAILFFVVAKNRKRAWILPMSFLGCGMSVGATAVAAFSFDPDSSVGLSIEQNTSMGRRLLSIARTLSDRDGDGASGLFGGGDCDDNDRDRWPGAIDVPGNRIDEDCSGADAIRKDYPEPTSRGEHYSRPKEIRDNLSLVILSVDAMRWDLGYMGYHRPITANIDKLAGRGIVFEKAYALSSFTGRSMAPMLIGRYPSEAYCNNSHFNRYLKKNEMLAEVLLKAGLRTAGVGSHFYFHDHGLEQGFERFYVEVPKTKKHIDQKVTSNLVANRAIGILGDPEFTKKRFFFWAHFMDPHRDYLRHEGFPQFGPKARDRYDGEVAFTDHHLGRVLKALEDTGLAERTVVIVTADHGEAFMEHDIRFHGRRLWEEVVRVPWIWVVPGMEPRRIAARVSHIDLVSTVYDLLRIEPKAKIRGRSLVPLMTGQEKEDRRIFIEQPLDEYTEEMYALLDNDYKLIHKIIGNRFWLFNLETDPGEQQNLTRSDPDRLEQMKETYRQIRAGLLSGGGMR